MFQMSVSFVILHRRFISTLFCVLDIIQSQQACQIDFLKRLVISQWQEGPFALGGGGGTHLLSIMTWALYNVVQGL